MLCTFLKDLPKSVYFDIFIWNQYVLFDVFVYQTFKTSDQIKKYENILIIQKIIAICTHRIYIYIYIPFLRYHHDIFNFLIGNLWNINAHSDENRSWISLFIEIWCMKGHPSNICASTSWRIGTHAEHMTRHIPDHSCRNRLQYFRLNNMKKYWKEKCWNLTTNNMLFFDSESADS